METEILDILNEVTGSKFRHIKTNLTKIKTLLNAGFSPQDIVEVIQWKTMQWLHNPVMSGYLCPTTLFRESNFEKYYNEVQRVKQHPERYAEYIKKINNLPTSAADHDATISDLYG